MKKQLPLLALFSLLLTANMVFPRGVFPSEKTISWQTGFEDSVTEIVIGANNVFTRFRNGTADAVSALDPSNEQAKGTVQVPKGIFNNMAYSSSGLLVSHPDGVICIDVNNGDFLWEINDNCDEGIILQASKLLLIDSFAIEMSNLDSRQKQWGESYFTDRFRSDFVVSENAIFMSFSGASTYAS